MPPNSSVAARPRPTIVPQADPIVLRREKKDKERKETIGSMPWGKKNAPVDQLKSQIGEEAQCCDHEFAPFRSSACTCHSPYFARLNVGKAEPLRRNTPKFHRHDHPEKRARTGPTEAAGRRTKKKKRVIAPGTRTSGVEKTPASEWVDFGLCGFSVLFGRPERPRQ